MRPRPDRVLSEAGPFRDDVTAAQASYRGHRRTPIGKDVDRRFNACMVGRIARSASSSPVSKGNVMSLVEGLASLLREMALGELALALVAILAYSVAINSSYSAALRSGAASVAFVMAVGFTTLTPSWMSAVVFLGLSIVGIAAFAGLAWMLSLLLGLGQVGTVVVAAGEAPVVATQPRPVRGIAPHTSAQPL